MCLYLALFKPSTVAVEITMPCEMIRKVANAIVASTGKHDMLVATHAMVVMR